MHGESAVQNALTTCLTRPATGIFCTNGRIFPVFSDQKQGKSLFWPHIYRQNSHQSTSLRENHRIGHRLHQIEANYRCVDRTRAYHNRAGKNQSVSGNLFKRPPVYNDHFSLQSGVVA